MTIICTASLVGAAVAGDRELHLVRAVLRDRDPGARRDSEREPARLADRHRGARVRLEEHALDRDRRRPDLRDQRLRSSSSSARRRSGSGSLGACGSHRSDRPQPIPRPHDHAVPAPRDAGIDAQHRARRVEHEFDARRWPRPRGSAENLGTTAAEQAPDHEQHEHADPDRHAGAWTADAPPGRAGRSARPRPSRCGLGPLVAGRREPAPPSATPSIDRAADVRRIAAARGASTSRSTFSTNWRSSFDDTSASTPRPNCATLPVIERSVDDVDLGAVAVAVHRDDDRRLARCPGRACRAPTRRCTIRRFGLVDLGERGRALVLRGDRADLHLHDAAVLVAVDLLQLRAGQARRDALDVEQHLPGLVDRACSPGSCRRSPSLQVTSQCARGLGRVDVGRLAGVVARYRDRRVAAEEHPRAFVARRAPGLGPVLPTDQDRIPRGLRRPWRTPAAPSSYAPATLRYASAPTNGWSARPTRRPSTARRVGLRGSRARTAGSTRSHARARRCAPISTSSSAPRPLPRPDRGHDEPRRANARSRAASSAYSSNGRPRTRCNAFGTSPPARPHAPRRERLRGERCVVGSPRPLAARGPGRGGTRYSGRRVEVGRRLGAHRGFHAARPRRRALPHRRLDHRRPQRRGTHVDERDVRATVFTTVDHTDDRPVLGPDG